MVDIFTLALTHGLIALALWRMLSMPGLDVDDAPVAEPRPLWRKEARGTGGKGMEDA